MARRALPTGAMPKVAVACQGGGMHAAFTVGVLTEILRDIDTRNRFNLVGLSGTSAGALCALMVWFGLAPKMQGPGSVPAAITQVNQAWNNFVAQTAAETLLNLSTHGALAAEEIEVPLLGISAGAFALNPYRAAYKILAASLPALGVRKQYFDLDAFLNAACPGFNNNIIWQNVTTRLLVGASEVVSGFETVFDSSVRTGALPANMGMMVQNSYWRQQLPLTLEGVAASGTLPVFREAERMGNHYYWDGLYSNNPPIREFFSGPAQYVPDEIWIVRINPQRWPYPPQTHAEIEDRQNELMGNLSLNKELDFIFAQQQPAPIVRTIKMKPNTADTLSCSSKFDRSRAFADQMRLEGREAAQDWLAHWPNVGTYPQDT